METEKLINNIKTIEFKIGKNFSFNLDKEFETLLPFLYKKNSTFLKQDFDFFLKKGKFLVINTLGGGILFLKVPETIDNIQLDYKSSLDEIVIALTFLSKQRAEENIKYKPDAGQIESAIWKMNLIFPHFHKYQPNIKYALMIVLGKIVKHICEFGRENFAYMKIVNEFEIKLAIDDNILDTLKVEIQ